MRVIISAGGTGGHIYPALSIVNKIKEMEPDSEFLYIGTTDRMEKDIVPKKGINYVGIEIKGLKRSLSLSNFKNIKLLLNAVKKCKGIVDEFKPDIVIGTGGYVTVPVIYAAKKRGIKTVIHEQNSIPGLANKMLSRYTDRVFISFRKSGDYFKNAIFTGNPCSEDAIKKEAINKEDLGLENNKKLVVIVMGSLGSNRVNDQIKMMFPLMKNDQYEVLFITGEKYYDEFKSIKNVPSNVKIVSYVDDLTRLLKKTDVVVSRAGASIISEIAVLEVPSILIPSPYVPNNHQMKNALDLVKKQAAVLLEESDLEGDSLVRQINELIENKDRYKQIKNNLKEIGVKNSATLIYYEIKRVLGDD